MSCLNKRKIREIKEKEVCLDFKKTKVFLHLKLIDFLF